MKIEGVFTLPDDREVKVWADYTPGRRPPYCTNPDSLGYSDCGEMEEIDVYRVEHEGVGIDLSDEELYSLWGQISDMVSHDTT